MTTETHGQYLTGAKWGDYFTGFLGTLISPLFFCFGGMIPILVFFKYREQYPALAKAIWLGIITVAILVFLSPALLIYLVRSGKG